MYFILEKNIITDIEISDIKNYELAINFLAKKGSKIFIISKKKFIPNTGIKFII